ATDECGNSTTATQTLTIVDTTAPEFTFVPEDATYECDEEVPAINAEASDNCGDVEVSYTDDVAEGECANEYSIVRLFTAVDACGNSSTAVQNITVVDTTAPVFDAFEIEVETACDNVDVPFLTATDNCGDVEITFEDTYVSGGCAGTIVRDYVAVDECGNEAYAQQILSLVDEVAPVFTMSPADMDADCDDIPAVSDALAAEDNCDEEVEISYLGEEIIEGDCPQSYTIVRTWVAIDDCDNETLVSQNINVSDNEAPEFEFVAEDLTLECDEELPAPFAVAFDNCGEVMIDVTAEIIDGECANEYTMIRTYVAIDECGNSTSATQTLTVVDTTAPVFTFVPADVTYECDEEIVDMNAEASDNCGEVSVTYTDDVADSDCDSEYSIVRVFTATDACGNTATASQNITVVDTTAPVLDGTPDAELALDCEDEVPAAADVTAFDTCEGDVEVSYTEELIGDLPAEGSSADCVAMTPEAYEDGETCAGTELWSVVLFNFDGQSASYYSTIDANWVEYPDGTATLTGTVYNNENANAGWVIDVEFENGLPWEEWSTQGFPTSFKDDCGISGDNHLDWMYYIMSEGATLTGWGDYDGSSLNLSHAPANYYYGYQVGIAANNVNENYGSGGWFTYSGSFLGADVNGSGDFAFDHDCCPQYSIERTWCAVDCAGNETCFTQVIYFEDQSDSNPVIGVDADEYVPVAFKGGEETRVNVYPNPAIDRATVEFNVEYDGMTVVEIISLNGQKVAEVYNANAEAGTNYRIDLDARNLPTGVYLYRLTTENDVITGRLVVNK
ncbi:MAG: T9SS type A sorting domain-containing protein, partial [Flavobacteriales bacterium]|nr:T9SS type A sorting domain-containing protein [Flavobacteriales bacterium]